MSGDWYQGPAQNGMYLVGQNPASDGTSKLALVRHGPILTPVGKSMTNKEILDRFKRDIENEARDGRTTKVKVNFTETKYSGADCLAFEQMGEDNTAKGVMSLNNEGMICLHPSRPYHFVWMALSERWPLGKSRSSTFSDDKKLFFSSLNFIN